MKVQIIGCGGVGSNLAYLLTKCEYVDQFVLCDHDLIEPKNMKRQFFFMKQSGMNKAEALKDNLLAINPELRIEVMKLRVEEELDLRFFDKDAVTILATDNVKSKQLCGKYFENFFLTNCEEGFFEIKTVLDKEELSAWDMGGGYMSTQTFHSNMACALKLKEYVERAINMLQIAGYKVREHLPPVTKSLFPFIDYKKIESVPEKKKESVTPIPSGLTTMPADGTFSTH